MLLIHAGTNQQDGERREVVAAAGGVLGRGVDQEAADGAPAAASTSREGQERECLPPFWLWIPPILQLTIQRGIPECTGGQLVRLQSKTPRYSKKLPAHLVGQKHLTCAGWTFRMVNWMCSVRLLIDRLATLEPRTGPTRVRLVNAASCKSLEDQDHWRKKNKDWI